jgi:succinate dehydrogenase/fumarate reductase flavoprotein subunit
VTGNDDVIVCGSGGAALVAAIRAHDGGARVRVLERSQYVGGTTAVSGGGIWVPMNDHMAEVGGSDTREDALAYCLRLAAGRCDPALIETFVDRGAAVLRWLEEHTPLRLQAMSWPDYHPEFEGGKATGRMLEPRLFDKGRCGEWAARLRPAPVLVAPITLQESTVDWKAAYFPERVDVAAVGSRVQHGLVACGQALIAALLAGCLDRGIPIELGARARRLLRDGERVTGVASDDAAYRGQAVVLATGGFEWNDDLKRQFLVGPLTHPNSPPVNEGDGLLMAMEAGAALGNMIEAWWYPAAVVPGDDYDGRQLARFVGTERTAPHSIMVNSRGERFVDEAANYNDMQKAFYFFDANEFAYRNIPCWVVFDAQYRRRYGVVTCGPTDPDPPWLLVGDTLDDLAKAAGIDAAGLARTVARFNRFVAGGRDEDFGRGDSMYDRFHGDPSADHPNLGTIEEGPFYALPVHTGAVGTKGGPVVNGHAQVIDVRGEPIPGLYAAGNVMANPAGPAYFGGGCSIGTGIVWGFLAGEHATSA